MGGPSVYPRALRLIAGVFVLAALLTTGANPISAQGPGLSSAFLLKDININPSREGSSPQHFALVGERLMFFANSDQHGYSLWQTDGTPDGTELVAQLGDDAWSVLGARAVNGLLLFGLRDDAHGGELWRSDGTPEGTQLLADINPGPASSFGTFELSASTGALLFFPAFDAAHGWGLWRSDGTAAGTFRLRKLLQFSGQTTTPPLVIYPVGNRVYFHELDPTYGIELWASDGTAAGTRPVRDINPGRAASNPTPLAAIGETLFFIADDGVHGREFWRSDGTAGGTRLVRDLNPGRAHGVERPFVAAEGWLYLFADDGVHGPELWRSDGTAGGTMRIPRPAADTEPLPSQTSLHAVGACAFVRAYSLDTGARLLASCGGAELRELHFFGDALFISFSFAVIAGQTVFSVYSGNQQGLWATDGTAEGTVWLAPLSNPSGLASFAGKVYFAGDDKLRGQELWSSDGTAAGTRLVKDIFAPPGGSMAQGFAMYGGRIYFQADDGAHGAELWVSDGTTGGTRLLADLLPGQQGSNPAAFAPFGGALVFLAGGNLWRTDGTAAGTSLITTADQPAGVAARSGLTVVGAQAFFTAGLQNDELWVLDADLRSARRVYSFRLTGKIGATPISPRYAIGGRLVFGVWTYFSPHELWSSDGTPAGTVRLAPDVAYLGQVNDRLIYTMIYGDQGLWATDGTPAGTVNIGDSGVTGWQSRDFISAGAAGQLFFTKGSTNEADWIFVTDGTAGGLRKISRPPGSIYSLAGGSEGAYFLLIPPSPTGSPRELWHTDGTSAGTRLVQVFDTTRSIDRPDNLRFVGGQLLFVAGDAAHGRELWALDRTTGSTRLCHDLYPGPASALPGMSLEIAAFDGRLLIPAVDGYHGEEIWSLPLAPLCPSTLYFPLIRAARP